MPTIEKQSRDLRRALDELRKHTAREFEERVQSGPPLDPTMPSAGRLQGRLEGIEAAKHLVRQYLG